MSFGCFQKPFLFVRRNLHFRGELRALARHTVINERDLKGKMFA